MSAVTAILIIAAVAMLWLAIDVVGACAATGLPFRWRYWWSAARRREVAAELAERVRAGKVSPRSAWDEYRVAVGCACVRDGSFPTVIYQLYDAHVDRLLDAMCADMDDGRPE